MRQVKGGENVKKLIIAPYGDEAIRIAEEKGFKVLTCSAYKPENLLTNKEVCWLLEVE